MGDRTAPDTAAKKRKHDEDEMQEGMTQGETLTDQLTNAIKSALRKTEGPTLLPFTSLDTSFAEWWPTAQLKLAEASHATDKAKISSVMTALDKTARNAMYTAANAAERELHNYTWQEFRLLLEQTLAIKEQRHETHERIRRDAQLQGDIEKYIAAFNDAACKVPINNDDACMLFKSGGWRRARCCATPCATVTRQRWGIFLPWRVSTRVSCK